jgi:hypothetical protein
MSTEAVEETEEFEVDLSALDDDELEAFEALLVSEYQSIRNGENEEFSATEARDELKSIAEALKSVRAEAAERIELAEADEVAESDSISAKLTALKAAKAAKAVELAEAAEAEAVAAPEKEEKEVEEEVEEELAEDVKITPKEVEGDSPVELAEEKAFNVTASADIRGFKAGQDLKSWRGVAEAFTSKRPDVRGTDPGADGTRFLVASVHGEFSEDRILTNDIDSNMAKIEAVASEQAITASGGLCAMITPYYQFKTWGDAHRPVRDALPVFKAERGGIRFMPSPVLTDLAGSVRVTTAAQDAAGYTNQDPAGTTAPKPCLHVTCEAEQTCIIEAIHRCLTFGNFGARTYPEQVEAWLKLGNVEFSRYSETRLIDAIIANSTAVTAAQTYGATFSILEQIELVVASFRARHRLSSNASFRGLFPFWLTGIIKNDIAAQAPGDGISRYNITDGQVSDWFSSRGVNPTWYQDHSTGAGAPFVTPAVGALETWPASAEWVIYPEGTFLYLDGGTLDLGLVRDSTLNSTNDYQIFYEEFNKVCKLGLESLVVTSDLCANGTYAPADELRVCTGS